MIDDPVLLMGLRLGYTRQQLSPVTQQAVIEQSAATLKSISPQLRQYYVKKKLQALRLRQRDIFSEIKLELKKEEDKRKKRQAVELKLQMEKDFQNKLKISQRKKSRSENNHLRLQKQEQTHRTKMNLDMLSPRDIFLEKRDSSPSLSNLSIARVTENISRLSIEDRAITSTRRGRSHSKGERSTNLSVGLDKTRGTVFVSSGNRYQKMKIEQMRQAKMKRQKKRQQIVRHRQFLQKEKKEHRAILNYYQKQKIDKARKKKIELINEQKNKFIDQAVKKEMAKSKHQTLVMRRSLNIKAKVKSKNESIEQIKKVGEFQKRAKNKRSNVGYVSSSNKRERFSIYW